MNIQCHFDGSCKPRNPGPVLGYGATVDIDGKRTWSFADSFRFKQNQSCNVAEYIALRELLIYLAERRFFESPILVKGDSKLVIEQMAGRYKIRAGMYRETAWECLKLKKKFKNITFKWIPREHNSEADSLSTCA